MLLLPTAQQGSDRGNGANWLVTRRRSQAWRHALLLLMLII